MRPQRPRHRAAAGSSQMISDTDLGVVKEGEEEERDGRGGEKKGEEMIFEG